MKPWKVLVLLAGLVGIAGFFLPFVKYKSPDGSVTGTISAYQIVAGIDDPGDIVDGDVPNLDREQVAVLVTQFNEGLAELKALMLGFFAPAVLLAVIGALAVARGRLGRISGVFALLLGVANIGVFLLFRGVAGDSGQTDATLGVGLSMLLAAGIVGAIGGLGALVSPGSD
ncbi:MAG: hypothetical protein WKG01_34750 [Kofleriaceae bacterium]